jgi:hypothetical protein
MSDVRRLTKAEMIQALAEVALTSEVEGFEDYELEDILSELQCNEISEYKLEEIYGETENYEVKCEDNRGGEGDGADMFYTFFIKNKITGIIGYLEFSGRYSSWDSSYYDECYEVQPVEVMVTQYKRVK